MHLAVACDVYDSVFLRCPFSHARGVLVEILNLIESDSECFPSYSSKNQFSIMYLFDNASVKDQFYK